MSEFNVSCDAAVSEGEGSMLALVVQSNGEVEFSRINRVSNFGTPGTAPVIEEIVQLELWATSLWRSDSGLLFLSDDDGNVHFIKDGGEHDKHAISPGKAITALWGASDTEVYAVGDAGIVFRWDGEAWHAVSPNLGSTLFSVDRKTGKKILVCGSGGALWEGDADDWQQIALPTQARLNGVLQHEEGGRWVCGSAGTLFHDDGKGWEPVSVTEADLHGVCWFRGALCLAAGTEGIFRLSNGKIENIKNTVTSYDLTSDGTYLVSSGDSIAIRYDGTTWAGAKFG